MSTAVQTGIMYTVRCGAMRVNKGWAQALAAVPAVLQVQPDAGRAAGGTCAARSRWAEVEQCQVQQRDSGFIRHLVGRGMPSWRQGLCSAD